MDYLKDVIALLKRADFGSRMPSILTPPTLILIHKRVADAIQDHACTQHIVDSINDFCEKDVHVQCALCRWSGKSGLSLLIVYSVLTWDILVYQQVHY